MLTLLHPEFYLRLVAALIFGFIIGLERTRKGKTAGIRTYTLVCLGSCLVMILSTLNQGQYRDPMRLAAQVVSGIGFLGVGVIWTDRHNFKRGLTTAANLWMTSSVGLVLGYGLYDIAIVAGILMGIAIQLHSFAEKVGLVPKDKIEQDNGDD
ncbi:MgtC/SapB family protein [Alicyclobacillus dauci]|uniref:MgtC/SapB family protein n=1 Tax=Alicyclobacillus dauci TaxID=1475485 RepID=A0ABY6Z7T8_9BACL|nr:MgtC/SapB family protein [Alicyclobacillus dauci]WAH38309.1 MgtC/SapB family protein [Alicyclobacillus dauci]